jgi:hypoxanthine phosphoribosyltransferase
MTALVTLKDKQFKPYLDEQEILREIKKMAYQINEELKNENPFFLIILNGSFMFAASLLKEIQFPCEISFVKLASYEGTKSTGNVNELIGLSEDITGRNIVILEDIVDTGETLLKIHHLLTNKKVNSIKVASLLFKPDSYKKNIPVDYTCFKIPNDFVVGYGLDYDGFGRNLKDIYVLNT